LIQIKRAKSQQCMAGALRARLPPALVFGPSVGCPGICVMNFTAASEMPLKAAAGVCTLQRLDLAKRTRLRSTDIPGKMT
jgi:hypothetical protein